MRRLIGGGRSRLAVVAGLTILVGWSGTTTAYRPAPTATVTQRTGSPTLHAWISGFQDWGGHGTNQATTPSQDAHNFDLIIDPTRQPDDASASLIDQLHRDNPSLKYLVYLNGCCHMGQDPTNYPESAYAHTSAGHRITGADAAPLMNRRDTTWFDARATVCHSWISQYHFDGCFYDSFSYDWFMAGNGVPIDPTTNRAWTRTDYDSAGQRMLAHVRSVIGPGKLIALNGLHNGRSFFAKNLAAELPNTDMAMAEDWLTSPTTPVAAYESEADWLADVNLASDMASRGKYFIPTVKSWAAGTTAQKDQLLKYATASFLLGADPTRAFLNFQNEHGDYGGTQYYAWWNANIGAPQGAFTHTAGCYQREFTRGRVLVNPTASSVTVRLGATYITMEGHHVTSLTLAPHTGEVLTEG